MITVIGVGPSPLSEAARPRRPGLLWHRPHPGRGVRAACPGGHPGRLLGRRGLRQGRPALGRRAGGQRPRARPRPGDQRLPRPSQGGGATAPGFGPAELAGVLRGHPRRLLVAERIGEPDERVVEGDPAEIAAGRWADPNVVVVFDETAAVGGKGRAWPSRRLPTRWALPEEAFEHRAAGTARQSEEPPPWAGMVTKSEVRALALAHLGPGPGDLVWDVGAGSGSV